MHTNKDMDAKTVETIEPSVLAAGGGTQVSTAEHSSTSVTPASKGVPKLALLGGRPALSSKYREKWKVVALQDALRVLKYMRKGITTEPKGCGIVGEFEKAFAKLTGSKYALTMNSGTAALHSAYSAIGIRPGDEVIVPTYTFFASASPVLQCGGTPVFCDINPDTLTADPEDVERRITPRTKAICVVHLWGNPAPMDRFTDIAGRHNLKVIEDCSHAHGATYQGRSVGSWGDIGCFSLQAGKPINAGEAGIAVTSDADLLDNMLALGHYGRIGQISKPDEFEIGNLCLGLKYRPHLYSVIMAAGGLRRLNELNALRRRNYDILLLALDGCDSIRGIDSHDDAIRGGLPRFPLRLDWQDTPGWSTAAFVKAANAEGVPVAADNYKPLHQEPLFTRARLERFGGAVGMVRPHSGSELGFPVAERVCPTLITLPAFTKVSKSFVRSCGRALVKVAKIAERVDDLRELQ